MLATEEFHAINSRFECINQTSNTRQTFDKMSSQEEGKDGKGGEIEKET